MSEQNYKNHARFVPGYHFVLTALAGLGLLASLWNLFRAMQRGEGRYESVLILIIVVAVGLLTWYVRVFPLKAQDRAIRAEENLRHYILAGKLLDPRLTIRQIIGLRFASDEEFVELARRAAEESLSEKEIKRGVKKWRADEYRV